LNGQCAEGVYGKIQANTPAKSVEVYPNPASNELFLQYQSKSETFEAQIFDVSGRLLMTTTFNNQNTATLNISILKQGFYIVNIVENNQITATKRFVKID
jgi:hypothetical protein